MTVTLPSPGNLCKGKTDKEISDEWKKMAKLHQEHTEENTTYQPVNLGVSIFNFQWASFASRASAIAVFALICPSSFAAFGRPGRTQMPEESGMTSCSHQHN